MDQPEARGEPAIRSTTVRVIGPPRSRWRSTVPRRPSRSLRSSCPDGASATRRSALARRASSGVAARSAWTAASARCRPTSASRASVGSRGPGRTAGMPSALNDSARCAFSSSISSAARRLGRGHRQQVRQARCPGRRPARSAPTAWPPACRSRSATAPTERCRRVCDVGQCLARGLAQVPEPPADGQRVRCGARIRVQRGQMSGTGGSCAVSRVFDGSPGPAGDRRP